MSLEDKLREILFNMTSNAAEWGQNNPEMDVNVERMMSREISKDYVSQIKQAFVDEGYIHLPTVKEGDFITINAGEVRMNGDGTFTPIKRLTGKEWYDRFEKALKHKLYGDHNASIQCDGCACDAVEAAKKVAGLK